jgi:hypothetical protein
MGVVSTVVRRSSGFIATLAVLFVLQAPLCALACLDGVNESDIAFDDPISPADPKPTSNAGHACHDESPASTPPGAPGSHDDCGCEIGANALVSPSSDSTSMSLQIFVHASTRWVPTASSGSWEAAVARGLDLPPPDILLLKSTLII